MSGFGIAIANYNRKKKESIPPTPTAYDSWFFFEGYRLAEGDLMIRGIRKNASIIHGLLLVLMLVGIVPAMNAEPAKILILPFHLPQDADQELQTFGEHVHKTLRRSVSGSSDQVKVESETATESALQGKPWPETDEEAQAMALGVKADLVVYGFLKPDESKFQMRGVMWDVRSARAIVSTDLKVSNIHELPGVLQLFVNAINKRLHATPRLPFYKTEPPQSTAPSPRMASLSKNTGSWRSPEIPANLVGVDIGDLDGDGKNETVLVEEGGVTISRFENGGLRQLTQFSESPAVYIAAEVEDVDGDGIAELLLCYQTPAGLESSIIKYTNRKLRVVGRFPHVILRTVREPGDDKHRILVGQRVDAEDMFSGEMIRYQMKDDEITAAGTVTLPPGTLLLSYAAGRFGRSGPFRRVVLNQDQRLMIFDQENRLLATLTDRLYGSDKKIRLPLKNGSKEISLPGRILITDTKEDGDSELLVAKQSDGSSFVQALGWDDRQFIEKWKTIRGTGVISDFRIRDFKNEGIRSFILLMTKPNLFLALRGTRSVIFAYDLVP
ncbi:MAG TPA: VCBS repeat-containing protein [Desulfomonilaceae bacterium]|nr:VCBS repeat-containing protein [Desulfomonilaceae bacterium]